MPMLNIVGFRCLGCNSLFQTGGGTDLAEYFEALCQGDHLCPRCGTGRIVVTIRDGGNSMRLTTRELWDAVSGRGFPDEKASIERATNLFLHQRITNVSLCLSSTGNVIINEISFDSGEVMCLTVSGGCAAINKIVTRGESNASDETP